VYLLHSEEKVTSKSKSEVCVQIENLNAKYGDKLFKAFYSVDELRPFSIVQIDKILEIYDNTWISPVGIVSKLDDKEKDLLMKKVIEFIESFEDENKRKQLVYKLVSWCQADKQFEFINQELGVFNENILKAIELNNDEKVAVSKNQVVSDELTSQQKDFTYHQALNRISTLSSKEQLKYYGKIYTQLGNMQEK
jgi:hypothetical protein